MPVSVSVKADIKDVTKMLLAAEKRHVPFAIASALTATAWDVRDNERKGMKRYLDRPTPFTLNGMKVQRATKVRQYAEVSVKPIQSSYLRYQITGGVRSPRRRAIVIGQTKRNKYGNTPGMRTFVSKQLAKPGTFEANINGTAGLWRRGRGGKLTLIALYTSKAQYKPRLPFYDIARKTDTARFRIKFDGALTRALATAR